MITILLQIAGGNNQSAVVGRSTVQGFSQWIVLDSASFNLADIEADAGGSESDSGGKASAQRGKSSRKAQSIAVTKIVDCSTIYLMQMAAKDRSSDARDENRSGKICFLQQKVSDTDQNTSALFPFLQIYLGSVVIDNWSISASEGSTDSTENFSINFKQFAMVFHKTGDATTGLWHGPKGWDETNRVEWEGPSGWHST